MTQLVYWGLSHPKYAFSPVVTAARKALCKQANELLLKEWRQYRHVHENYNAITGEGGDVSSSDPFYHWVPLGQCSVAVHAHVTHDSRAPLYRSLTGCSEWIHFTAGSWVHSSTLGQRMNTNARFEQLVSFTQPSTCRPLNASCAPRDAVAHRPRHRC